MNRHIKVLHNQVCQPSWPDGLVLGATLLDEFHQLGGEFVGLPRTALSRYQPCHTASLESSKRLIKRRTRKTKRIGGPADGLAFNLRFAQHLVLHLNNISGIEKVAALKQLVPDGIWPGVECALLS